ncbi:MAG: hypothetical protein ACXVCP_04250 [Bdellovibrio sp.]
MNIISILFQLFSWFIFVFVMAGCSSLSCIDSSGDDSSVTNGYILPFRSEPKVYEDNYPVEQTLLFCDEKPDCQEPRSIFLYNDQDNNKFKVGTTYAVSLRGVSRYRCMPGAVDVHQGHIGFKIESAKEWSNIKSGECLNYEILASSGFLYKIKHSPDIIITDEIKKLLDSVKNQSSVKFQLCWRDSLFYMGSVQL